jgi:hypothetical protein
MINTKTPFQASILATAILLTACGGDNDSSNNFTTDDKPVGFSSQTTGTSVISALGGDSASQQGGHGGSVNIGQTNSPAALKILTSGTPDTSYQLPTTSIQLGSLSVIISEDTEVEILTRVSSSTDVGTLYLSEGKNRLYQYDGESDFEARNNEVTGLIINADATLTLEANSGNDTVLLFANDLVNNGSIETYVSNNSFNAGSQRASISLYPSAYNGTGNISTSGAHPGQAGGNINISASSIINSGELTSRGQDGEDIGDVNGGLGGSISLSSSTFIENKGVLNTSGGHSEEGTSGAAGSVSMSAEETYNSGKILAEAGEGKNATKPDSNQSISLFAQEVLINTGNLSVNGTDSIEDGYATDAGNIILALESNYATRSNNRRLINDANIIASGGSTETTGSNQTAGQGGNISISATELKDDGSADTTESLMIIAGNLVADGGHSGQEYVEGENGEDDTLGSNAGDAGNIFIEHNSSRSHNLPTYLSGYKTIQVDGGEGLQAGNAGSVDITSRKTTDEMASLAGPITVESNISADGGESFTSLLDQAPSAGTGGDIDIRIIQDQAYLQAGSLTINLTGNASANAGDVENGNSAGSQGIILSAPHGITAVADLSANGSSDTENEDDDDLYNRGSAGGSIGLFSYEGNISFSGSVTANGGNGLTEGGDAGAFSSVSSTMNLVSGSITLNGGDADADPVVTGVEETQGGDAGVVYIYSDDYSATLSASVTTLAGTGEDPGREGGVFVNADCQQGSCNDRDENLIY